MNETYSTERTANFTKRPQSSPLNLLWAGPENSVAFDSESQRLQLLNLTGPLFAVVRGEEIGLTQEGHPGPNGTHPLAAWLPALLPESLGDDGFKTTYGTRYALYGGAMANGISSTQMVIALGEAGMMGSFGAGGLIPVRVEEAIHKIQAALPQGPYMFNLLNSPSEPAMERNAVELFLKYGVRNIEASAYLGLTRSLVYYRASGLSQLPTGEIRIANHIVAKLSRKEVARRFMEPAPEDMLSDLVAEGKITPLQAELAKHVPMADDITAEGDSGGHTDNRPLVSLLPAMLAYRDELQGKYNYPTPVRIGAGGGISTPASALAAFMMGAAYVVTGSINQACIESGASDHTRALLAQAAMTDVTMAPSSDMFEMGVRVQVLKRGTLFPMRASKLYELYNRYDSLEDIPAKERETLETKIFQRGLGEVWSDTVAFFTERDPRQIERAEKDPKQKMALVFRWYLGLSSRWSNQGVPERRMDYQIWCGPSMGAFNDWVRGTTLEEVSNRHVVNVNLQLLKGCAYLFRLRMLDLQGIHLPQSLANYLPV